MFKFISGDKFTQFNKTRTVTIKIPHNASYNVCSPTITTKRIFLKDEEYDLLEITYGDFDLALYLCDDGTLVFSGDFALDEQYDVYPIDISCLETGTIVLV